MLGPRQIGKTTGLQQILRKWRDSKLMATADSLAPPDTLLDYDKGEKLLLEPDVDEVATKRDVSKEIKFLIVVPL